MTNASGVPIPNATVGSNYSCDERTFSRAHLPVLAGVNILNLLTNTLLIVSVRMAPSLKGITGWLMINEHLSSLLSQLPLMCILYIGEHSFLTLVVLSSIGRSLHLASIALLTLQNINMYLAVCRPTSSMYRTYKNTRYFLGMIVSVWVVVSLLSVLNMQREFYDMTCQDGDVRFIYRDSHMWLPVLMIIFGVVLPSVPNIFCVWRVHESSLTIAPIHSFRQIQEKLRILKQAKLMFLITILVSLTLFPITILRNTNMTVGSPTSALRLSVFIWSILHLIYVSVRPVIYFTCYRPLWTAAKRVFCGRKTKPTNTTRIEVRPRPEDAASADRREADTAL